MADMKRKILTEIKLSFLDTFALTGKKMAAEDRRIVAEDHKTAGKIALVTTCWWIKVNTKPMRLHTFDGARFPHIIYFTYAVDGKDYRGISCVGYLLKCPYAGEDITVYYDKSDPTRYVVRFS